LTISTIFQPYPGVDIKNFSTSWSDGLGFGALLHRWRPDILDFANFASKSDPHERLDIVFKVAHDVLGIERLLDPEGIPSLSLFLYDNFAIIDQFIFTP